MWEGPKLYLVFVLCLLGLGACGKLLDAPFCGRSEQEQTEGELLHLSTWVIGTYREYGNLPSAEWIPKIAPIFREPPKDRWGQFPRVMTAVRDGDFHVRLISAGPDRIFGTADDIEVRRQIVANGKDGVAAKIER